MMSHIVESCPLTNLGGSLLQLHSADDTDIFIVGKPMKIIFHDRLCLHKVTKFFNS